MGVLAAFMMPHPPLAVPEVGKGGEAGIPATMSAFDEIGRRIADLGPEVIVVISPHAPTYADYFHISPGGGAAGDFGSFGVPEVKVNVSYDRELAADIGRIADECGLAAGTMGASPGGDPLDHGVMVPLWFVNKFYSDYKIVRISVSGLCGAEHYRLGKCVKAAIVGLGRRAVVIASGDLSHKLKEAGKKGEECRAFDEKITRIMKNASFDELLMMDADERQSAADCGSGAFMILSGVFDKMRIRPEFLSYEATYGVGYAQCAYNILSDTGGPDYLELYETRFAQMQAKTRDNESPLVRLARSVVESFVKNGRIAPKNDIVEKCNNERAGVFVSIKKMGALRGCIGTLEPTTPSVAAEVCQMAVSACSRDFRFDPVTPEELPFLTYSVDVLSAPEAVARGEIREKLDPSVYGVIVAAGDRRGVLLPDLEGIDTADEQLQIALRKAGITGDAYTVERFKVTRHT